ncbi:hypothetical protein ACP70R_008674 [Stipagrostis hirtigluma subsp. patula]
MEAQGAVSSLLGRLTTILVKDAQLLGGIRRDVEFIRDDMEVMRALLLHLTEAQHHGRHVRAWTKQVAGLSRDCEGKLGLYIHYVRGGPGGNVRHKIATQIRELKVRALDISQRQERYGITLPNVVEAQSSSGGYAGEDRRRRAIVLDGTEPPADEEAVKEGIDTLIKWLLPKEAPPAAVAASRDGVPQPMVISIVGGKAGYIAEQVYEHLPVATSFCCKALVRVHSPSLRHELEHILEQVTVVQTEQAGEGRYEEEHSTETSPVDEDEEQLISRLQGHLKGKRFMIVLADVQNEQQWKSIMDPLKRATDGCHSGSSIIMTTDDDQVALSPSPFKIFSARNLLGFYNHQVWQRNVRYSLIHDDRIFNIFHNVYPNAFAMKMFMNLLYVNSNRTHHELEEYCNAILECKRLNKSTAKQVLKFCYRELHSKLRSCLLYLTIFPKGKIIRATSLARRWIAEGLIDRNDETSSGTDEATRYLDVLVARGFVSPVEINAVGHIKSCTLHHEVHEFIMRIARDVSYVDANLPPDLAQHLSIHNWIGLKESHSDGHSRDIVASLRSLAESSQWQLLKVLDLECCKGLKKGHLKIICKMLHLKYLSLRNTDVVELPKQIKELQCLETLDIRQTKVQMLGKKAIVLPLLKQFLAGHKVSTTSGSEEPFVCMPLSIEKMRNIQILSHVHISNSAGELAGIAQLLKLRKLGVVFHDKNAKLNYLFYHIENLGRHLRSLSIRISRPAGQESHGEGMVHVFHFLPHFIESLNISGITSGFPRFIQKHHHLTKITLTETYMKGDDLRILGKLRGLLCLRLQDKSYTETELGFKDEEFQRLKFLIVEGKDVTTMSFLIGSAPKLERIVWSFDTMVALSGVCHLRKLMKLELNGDCNLDPVRVEILWHPNYPYHPVLKHNPHHQCEEDRATAAASSSSAP